MLWLRRGTTLSQPPAAASRLVRVGAWRLIVVGSVGHGGWVLLRGLGNVNESHVFSSAFGWWTLGDFGLRKKVKVERFRAEPRQSTTGLEVIN